MLIVCWILIGSMCMGILGVQEGMFDFKGWIGLNLFWLLLILWCSVISDSLMGKSL